MSREVADLTFDIRLSGRDVRGIALAGCRGQSQVDYQGEGRVQAYRETSMDSARSVAAAGLSQRIFTGNSSAARTGAAAAQGFQANSIHRQPALQERIEKAMGTPVARDSIEFSGPEPLDDEEDEAA